MMQALDNTNSNAKADIILFLLHNKQFLQKQTAHLRKKREELSKTEDVSLQQDIKDQHDEVIRMVFAVAIGRELAVSAEEIYMVLEDLNIEEYLA
jgi:hypothetical protein